MLVYIVSFPLVIWFMVYMTLRKIMPKSVNTFKLVCDAGVVLWFYACAVLLESIVETNVAWLLLAVCCAIFPINAIWQRVRHEEVVFTKMFVHGWRLLFLFLVPAHAILFAIGIAKHMIH
ncbi:DUF3397 domain-containing protein [Exiguobacterium aurantiacum]|uniref:Protein of uncharacterized function (DUF3397) n=1 Tax=Exiguobacterium aurantiacum TaxID=33987 RepID=A0A377FVV5_9BACL|nr:DUF3397 domain-containing protein [Exiguobacterium aurantiacum]STO08555.1 Protein of uncharacterised function (DUF3397) [Exiguobacterium aurantiacum]